MHEGPAACPEAAADEQQWFTADSKSKVNQNLLMFHQPDLSSCAQCHRGMFLGCEGHQGLCCAELASGDRTGGQWAMAPIQQPSTSILEGERIDSLGTVRFKSIV